MPKQFINRKEDVVVESIKGICAATPHLEYLDGLPEIKVVVDATFPRGKQVAVVSGGGAGHEPAHAGYIGSGMLSAVAVGDIFASPPVEAVLAAIQSVTGQPGCLLIVKNYTGDRLNFGLAAEKAKGLGLKVELVVIGDDCALPGKGLAGRRGISGTVFVHKVAGAAAAEGMDLEEVTRHARAAAAAVGSMGVAAGICTLPGAEPSDRLADDEMELGLGIHGESGASKRQLMTADPLVAKMADTIVEYMRFTGAKDEFALLINNLGGVSCLEMGVLIRAAVDCCCRKHQLRLTRCYSGTFMTSVNMAGFSLSLLRLEDDWKRLLDAETQAPAWPGKAAEPSAGPQSIPLPETGSADGFRRPSELTESGRLAEECISAAVEALVEAAPELDKWDQMVGDGDCGATVKRGALAVREALGTTMPLNDAAATAKCLADCARSMGGTSGALYNIFFTAAAASLPETGWPGSAPLAEAVATGTQAIARYGGGSVGNRTMLDALSPASNALSRAAEAGEAQQQIAQASAQAADEGAEATRSMTAGAGRSSYVPVAATRGVLDPGAKAVAIWIEAVARQLSKKGCATASA